MKICASIVFLLLATTVNANSITLENIGPVVVSSSPQAGTNMVAASTKEIRVTFSKEMMTNKMWSVVMLNKPNFPKITGKVKFLQDNRTFVIPVSLEENTVYALSFNAKNKHGFKGVNGNAAQPYLLSFKTGL